MGNLVCPQRNGPRNTPPPCAVVIKIGGSACTIKSSFETLNSESLEKTAAQLAKLVGEGVLPAVVHGAGSFGHFQAREFGVSKGTSASGGSTCTPRLREGLAKTRLSVTTLNKHVVSAMVSAGIPAVSISPCPFVHTSSKKLEGSRLPAYALDGVYGLLRHGFVPVVHGDAVLDTTQSCAILSGDVWTSELCRELAVDRCVFLTDVPGVYTCPPSEPGASLIKEVLVDQSGELQLPEDIKLTTVAHDVTGGIKAKLQLAADVLQSAPSLRVVFIVQAGSESALQAMKGEEPDVATILKRSRGN